MGTGDVRGPLQTERRRSEGSASGAPQPKSRAWPQQGAMCMLEKNAAHPIAQSEEAPATTPKCTSIAPVSWKVHTSSVPVVPFARPAPPAPLVAREAMNSNETNCSTQPKSSTSVPFAAATAPKSASHRSNVNRRYSRGASGTPEQKNPGVSGNIQRAAFPQLQEKPSTPRPSKAALANLRRDAFGTSRLTVIKPSTPVQKDTQAALANLRRDAFGTSRLTVIKPSTPVQKDTQAKSSRASILPCKRFTPDAKLRVKRADQKRRTPDTKLLVKKAEQIFGAEIHDVNSQISDRASHGGARDAENEPFEEIQEPLPSSRIAAVQATKIEEVQSKPQRRKRGRGGRNKRQKKNTEIKLIGGKRLGMGLVGRQLLQRFKVQGKVNHKDCSEETPPPKKQDKITDTSFEWDVGASDQMTPEKDEKVGEKRKWENWKSDNSRTEKSDRSFNGHHNDGDWKNNKSKPANSWGVDNPDEWKTDGRNSAWHEHRANWKSDNSSWKAKDWKSESNAKDWKSESNATKDWNSERNNSGWHGQGKSWKNSSQKSGWYDSEVGWKAGDYKTDQRASGEYSEEANETNTAHAAPAPSIKQPKPPATPPPMHCLVNLPTPPPAPTGARPEQETVPEWDSWTADQSAPENAAFESHNRDQKGEMADQAMAELADPSIPEFLAGNAEQHEGNQNVQSPADEPPANEPPADELPMKTVLPPADAVGEEEFEEATCLQPQVPAPEQAAEEPMEDQAKTRLGVHDLLPAPPPVTPTPTMAELRTEGFLRYNFIDNWAAAEMRLMSLEQQKQLLALNLRSCRNPSKKLMCRMKELRREGCLSLEYDSELITCVSEDNYGPIRKLRSTASTSTSCAQIAVRSQDKVATPRPESQPNRGVPGPVVVSESESSVERRNDGRLAYGSNVRRENLPLGDRERECQRVGVPFQSQQQNHQLRPVNDRMVSGSTAQQEVPPHDGLERLERECQRDRVVLHSPQNQRAAIVDHGQSCVHERDGCDLPQQDVIFTLVQRSRLAEIPVLINIASTQKQTTFGGGSQCDVRLRVPHLSDVHADFVIREVDGLPVLMLVDTSPNGTWLNGAKVPPLRPIELQTGDQVSFLNPYDKLYRAPVYEVNDRRTQARSMAEHGRETVESANAYSSLVDFPTA